MTEAGTPVANKSEERIRSVVEGIRNLPTPPIVFNQIQKVLNNPNTSAIDIASILQEDAAMSAKVLRLTNSAYYGLVREVESVRQAVVIVGLEAIKNLVLSASVMGMFSKEQIDREFQDYFWRHSLATGFAAKLIAYTFSAHRSFDAEGGFSAAMLHDIGKMVVSVFMVEDGKKIKEMKTANPGKPDYVIEEEILGYNHAQIGMALAEKWKLPAKLAEAVKYHHFPQLCESEENSLPYLIHISNYLAKYTFDYDSEEENSHLEPLQDGMLEYLGVSLDELHGLSGRLREEYAKSETFLEMAKGA